MTPARRQPHEGGARHSSGRLSSDKTSPAEDASAAPGATNRPRSGGVTGRSQASGPSLDPELIEDLGPEFELRGDVLESELEAVRAEAAEMRDLALRAQAEFDNFRKRVAREREDERKRATERLVEELLPAIDNLERAIEHTTADNDINHLLTGVTSVHAQIVGILGKEGVTILDPLYQPFDPNTAQAVSQQEDLTVPEGTVIAAFQKGYEMGGRIIRPAMVVVSTGGPRREE